MTPKEAEEKMAAIVKRQDSPFTNIGEDHIEADNILCDLLQSLGYGEVIDIYKNIRMWHE